MTVTTPQPTFHPPSQRPGAWPLAMRSLWRDFRAGELRLLVLAVALAVALGVGVLSWGQAGCGST